MDSDAGIGPQRDLPDRAPDRPAKTPLVYISIVNWNGADKTLACVADVLAQTYRHFRILVVDNASRPGNLEYLENRLVDADLLKSGKNVGYAGGHSLSVERAKADRADLLWILNNDTRIGPDVLEQLVAAYDQYGDGVYGGVPLKSGGRDDGAVLLHKKYLSPDFRQAFFTANRYRKFGEIFGESREPVRVSAISGSCFLLPVSMISSHGFMDIEYFLYAEEIDYCFRLKGLGVPVWLVPSAVITHEGEGSSSGKSSVLSDLIQYYRTRNQLVFICRYGSVGNALAAQLKNLAVAGHSLLRGRFRRAGFILRGMLDGAAGRLGKSYAPEDYL